MSGVRDVFISYGHDDRATARRVADALEAEGLSVWWDDSLRSGDAYDQVIEQALRDARAVVVLWSKTSVDSRWVRAEATLADRQGTLAPAMIEPCQRPIMFELTHTADLSAWTGDPSDAAWRSFVADVKRFTGSGQAAAAPASPKALPAEPPANSICVLPFANMSGDPEQDMFAAGLTEDIITALSRFRQLFVISRTSAFQYKEKAVGAPQVAREFNVHYVVEGSVRKAGARVRVNVQLIDGQADRHIWAERYDRQLEDIFDLQDEVTAAICSTLCGRVEEATGEKAGRKPTENMTAYEHLLAGKLLHHRSTRADNEKALGHLRHAIALDPLFAQAHAWKACTLGQAWVNSYSADPAADWMELLGELDTALRLNSNDSDVHRILAAVNLVRRDHDKALFHQERALELNPNDDLVVVQQGEILTWVGRADEGIGWIEKAMRLNPCHPERYWNHLGRAYFVAHRYHEAISAFSRIATPILQQYAFMAACAAQLGDAAAASRYAAEVRKRDPDFCAQAFLFTLHYKREEDIAHHRAALVAAGLPDCPPGSPIAAAASGAAELGST
jgi:adenylate cyclase